MQTGISILISDKIDLKLKLTKRTKTIYIFLIKGRVNEEEIIIINIYSSNSDALDFIKLNCWI